MIDSQLLEVLACPEDNGPLVYFPGRDLLYNPRLRRQYFVRDGIPNMLIDDSVTAQDADHKQLMDEMAAQGLRPNFETA